MNHTVLGSALSAAGIRPFDFCLVDAIKSVHSKDLSTRVLSRVAFACDAYIGIAIQRALTALRVEGELNGTQAWDTYQAFLQYASGIAANEETMTEAGMEVDNLRETVQKLYTLRCHVHTAIHGYVGESYKIPDILGWMRNPRVRRDDPGTLAKLHNTFKAMAQRDDGVIDVDLERQLAESYAVKSVAQKQDMLKWDKQRGELSALFFNALKIRDDIDQVGYDDEHDPFGDLDASHQYKLLTGAGRYVRDVLTDMATDRKVRYEEHAAAVIESRPLLKSITLAAEHPRFADVA